ncbi:peroxiredoxin [Sessilibacter sp. MAH1]
MSNIYGKKCVTTLKKGSLLSTLLYFMAASAQATLSEGEIAPQFALQASKAGQEFSFDLQEALKTGPVVVYFYPRAFTAGCTVEAHTFAEASDDFAELNTTIIGVSTDDIKTLNEFSVSECRNKFAVAADTDATVTRAYDSLIKGRDDIADRVSYVIAPSGEIIHVLHDSAPKGHISQSLTAIKNWQATHE